MSINRYNNLLFLHILFLFVPAYSMEHNINQAQTGISAYIGKKTIGASCFLVGCLLLKYWYTKNSNKPRPSNNSNLEPNINPEILNDIVIKMGIQASLEDNPRGDDDININEILNDNPEFAQIISNTSQELQNFGGKKKCENEYDIADDESFDDSSIEEGNHLNTGQQDTSYTIVPYNKEEHFNAVQNIFLNGSSWAIAKADTINIELLEKKQENSHAFVLVNNCNVTPVLGFIYCKIYDQPLTVKQAGKYSMIECLCSEPSNLGLPIILINAVVKELQKKPEIVSVSIDGDESIRFNNLFRYTDMEKWTITKSYGKPIARLSPIV